MEASDIDTRSGLMIELFAAIVIVGPATGAVIAVLARGIDGVLVDTLTKLCTIVGGFAVILSDANMWVTMMAVLRSITLPASLDELLLFC